MRKLLFLMITVLAARCLAAQPLRIAVAANVRPVMEVLRKDFTKATGIPVEIIAGASGKLAAQIENGAPYDIFLSADTGFPEQLYKKGVARSKPTVYAMGSLIFCSASAKSVNNWRSFINTPGIKRIAIANTATAPYGRAAEEALKYYGLLPDIQRKLVYGESISQVNTYITTATVSGGLTTESLVHDLDAGTNLKWVRIDKKAYQPIKQAAVLLKRKEMAGYKSADKFYRYLFSAAAKAMFRKYGYN